MRDYNTRLGAVIVGEFVNEDAAVVQTWHERDVEDAEYYAHRLAERRGRNADGAVQAVDAVVDRNDTALDMRIQRARMLQQATLRLDATSGVEDLTRTGHARTA